MAQRKGELLKMEMLEKLASLHRDLREEVEMATQAGGASNSAIQAAKELLGCDKAREAAFAARVGPARGPECATLQQLEG